MSRTLVWLAVGGALVVYLSLSWGLLGVGGGQPTPVIEQIQTGPGTVRSGDGAPTSTPGATPSAAAPTPGPTPTPLPAEILEGQGETFVLLQAGVVTHGARVVITGQGFKPGEPLVVILRGSLLSAEREVGRGFANKEGQLENVGFDVPADLPPGQYVVHVQSAKGERSAQARLRLTEGQPGVEPDIYAGKPGSKVSFAGGGFKPGERIAIYFDSLGGDPIGTVAASKTGTVKVAGVPVPLSQEGPHAFVFLGEQSQVPVRVPFSVTGLYPFVVLDNYTPLPQQAVGISGEDFYPGERVLIFMNEVSATPLAVAIASPTGAIQADGAVPVPVDLRGTVTVIALGEQSGTTTSVELTIQEFAPALELTTYSGPPGTTIGFTGSAFAADEVIHVYDGRPEDKRELTSFQTGPNGAFKAAGSFQLPIDAPVGKLTLTAVGEKSRVPVGVVFSVQGFQAGLNLTSYAGKAGSMTAFSGSGFVSGEKLRAYLGRSENGQEVASFEAGADGSFEDAGAFVIPYGSPPGQLPIVVLGDKSKTPVTVEYTVLPFTPWAGLSAYAGPVGSQVSFLGGDFAPGEIVDVHLGDARGRVVVSATADDEGKFPLTDAYTIEAGATEVTFTLVGETSQAVVTAKFKVTPGAAGEAGPADEKPQSP